MKKKNFILLFITAFVIMVTACQKEPSTSVPEITENEIVEPESLQYWIDKLEQPDELLLNAKEVANYNKKLLKMKEKDWIGGSNGVKSFPEIINAHWLKEQSNYLDLQNAGYFYKGELVTPSQWDTYFSFMNLDSATGEIPIRYGIIIRNTAILDLPTDDILTNSSLNESENRLQQSYLKMNEPVVVLWESSDKNWLYVASFEYTGWIKESHCAFVEKRSEWLKFQENENFLICYDDQEIDGIEDTILLGSKLYLSAQNASPGTGGYWIDVPARDKDGQLVCSTIQLPQEAKVWKGYLPYTSRNLLELAFSRLGDPYGWGGINGKRDCSSYVRDIYYCFGFMLPRNSSAQMNLPAMATNTDKMTVAKKAAILEDTLPGAILGINGHIMLYLGSANGQHYVISMLGSYIPETVTADFGNHIEYANKVMVNTLDVKRKSGNTWLQELLSVVEIK